MGSSGTLKRVRGKPDVFRLQRDLHAWNVDGSSANKPVSGSWIKHWEYSTGKRRGTCAYRDCLKPAVHGGHVWITGGHSSVARKVCWIVPICKECNSCRNPDRMQSSMGNHPYIRDGTVIVKTDFTPEMATAYRRIAMDYTYERDSGYASDEYEYEIMDTDDPLDVHTESDWHDAMEIDDPVDVHTEGDWPGTYRRDTYPHTGRKQKIRICKGWGCEMDISNRNPDYDLCYSCWKKNAGWKNSGLAQKSSKLRRCQDCRKDISHRDPDYKLCYSCWKNDAGWKNSGLAQKSSKLRRCQDCRKDISHRDPNYKLCYSCWKKDTNM